MKRQIDGVAEFVRLDAERRAYCVLPAGEPPFPCVLLFPEAFGIDDYIQNECRRLAQHGYAAIAPDIFRGETDERLMEDVRAAVQFAEDRSEIKSDELGAVGFCMGGRLAFLTALELGTRIGAAVSFYGGGMAPLRDRIGELQSPVLLLYGADDEGIPPSEHARLAEALSRHKKRYTLSVFPEAGHGFASVDRPNYRRKAAEAAWDMTLEFFPKHM